MPYVTSGKCVYKKKPDGSRGKKVGCTEGSVDDYLAALHMHADESKEPLDIQKTLTEWKKYIDCFLLKEATYRRGMRDPSVGSKAGPIAKIQQKLIDLGHLPQIPESEYGIYGPKTKAAVKKFQRKVFPGQPGEHDGVIGTDTFGALSKTAGGFVVPPPSPTTAKPKAPSAATQKKATKIKPKKPKYFKGMKRPEMTFAKKGPASAKMTPLKLIASGKLGSRGKLEYGVIGQEVEALKIWLGDYGFFKTRSEVLFGVDPAGQLEMVLDYYDEKTEAAVKKYQKTLNLKTTGEINQETAIAMVKGVAAFTGGTPSKAAIYKKIFGTPAPHAESIAAIIKNQVDVVDQNYQTILRNAASEKDAILFAMIGTFVKAVKAQGGTDKTAWRFYNSFLGLARKTIQEKGYTEWFNKFKEFALDPAMSEILLSKDLDKQKIKRFISKIFDLDQLNAQMFAAHMKSAKTEYTEDEKKVLRYLHGPNSFLVFNLGKTTLSWVLACGRKSTGKGNCKPLQKRNFNNLAEMVHQSDLVLKRWRATSGDLEVYKKIKGKIDKDSLTLAQRKQTFSLQDKRQWPLIGKLEKAFRQIGKAQNADIRQAKDLGPLPIGVYRVSDYQEKDTSEFEEHFSRNMSKQINKQLEIFKDPEEREEFLKLMKKFNFVPTKARDIRTTVGARGKQYRGRKPASWNVRTLTSAAYAWGTQRMWLTILNVPDAKAAKRTGFSIHGGAAFGSAGCLDLGPAMGNFSRFYKKAVGNRDILLVSTDGVLPNRVSKKYYLGIEKGGTVEGATV